MPAINDRSGETFSPPTYDEVEDDFPPNKEGPIDGNDWDVADNDSGDEAFENGDSFGSRPQNVTRDQILELFHKLDGQNRPDEKDLLNTLREALREVSTGNQEKAWEGFNSVSIQTNDNLESNPHNTEDSAEEGALGDFEVDTSLLEDPTESEATEENSEEEEISEGSPPSRTENGVHYYETTDSGEWLDLRSPGKGSKNIVNGEVEATITPRGSQDLVMLSEMDGKIVVKVSHEGKDDIYRFDKKSKVTINTDPRNVSGELENQNDNILIGINDPQPYISELKTQEIAEQVTESISWIGGKISGDSQEKNQTAKEILQKLSDYLGEKNPDQKDEKLESLNDAMSRRLKDSSWGANHRDDIAQIIFEVLYQGLGEENLKYACKKQALPKDFIEDLASSLTGAGSDATSEDYNHVEGNTGQTHQASADFLKRYAGITASSQETPIQK